ncbi:MAG: hypothetical protein II909_02020, partial [Kiritimatiellae bacterium]|nr:hypothetical protein [Kiritimatiellia bacterium]
GGQILHIKLHSQELFASGINIYSNPVSKIAKRMDCLGNWGEFAHTVTDSIALECRIEDLMRQRLDFQRKSSK